MIQTERSTKERILDAAERLFGEHGFGATSLRSVIAEAKVNLAAVHYHYGSKEALIAAVIHRRVEPLNKERLMLLEECEREADGAGLELGKLVDAFIGPLLRHSEDPEHGWNFMKLLGRAFSEPEIFFKIVPGQFREIGLRFLAAFQKALPEVPPEELFWRLMFSVGTVAHTMRVGQQIPALSQGLCKVSNAEENIRRLEAFLVAGLRAPASGVDQ